MNILAVLLLSAFALVDAINIEDYGAVTDIDTWDVALKNTAAVMEALAVANSSSTDRTINIPAGKLFYMTAIAGEHLYDITIVMDGTFRYSNLIENWSDEQKGIGMFGFTWCEGIYIKGSGTFDGQGLDWWRLAYTGDDHRPNLFEIEVSRDIYFEGVTLLSSPRYSIGFKDCADIVIHDITIFIDSSFTRIWGKESVTYALNTDGIDLAATNATIYNTNITNYDDAIVAKPCRDYYVYCTCAGPINAYNNTITYSTGLTIGSVPPNDNVNCIRNVTFKDTTMYRPLKALYIKSNPGDNGKGIIEDILYENIYINQALWWTIWVGPQQQNQPSSSTSTGCNFFFPFYTACPTNPLVSMQRVTFRNVTAVDTVPTFEGPGVFLCDKDTPCVDFVFEEVTNTPFSGNITDIIREFPFHGPGIIFPTPFRSDDWEFGYISSNLYGTTSGTIDPPICVNDEECFWDGNSKHSDKPPV